MKRSFYWLMTMLSGGAVVAAYFTLSASPLAFAAACTVAGMGVSLFVSLGVGSSVDAARLSKVPEIAALIEQAETQEQRVADLESALRNMDKIVARESRRLHLEAELRTLEARLLAMSSDYEKILHEIGTNEQSVQVDPEFEARVEGLVKRIREERAFKENLFNFRTGSIFVDLLLDATKVLVARL